MRPDLDICLVFNTRMAARAMTRRYDAALRPFGVTSAQFALLGQIRRFRGDTLQALADRVGLDRTSLTRNLDVLEKMGLIAVARAGKGNGRRCVVTDRGLALIADIAPVWQQAQAEMRDLLTPEGFETTLNMLKRLSAI